MTGPGPSARDERDLQALSTLARRVTAADGGGGRTPGARWVRLAAALDPTSAATAGLASPLRRRWHWAAAAGAAAVAGVVALVLAGSGAGRPLTYAVQGASLGGDHYITGITAVGAALTFSDGTAVRLEQGSRAWVVDTDRRGARLRLSDGQAHLSVVHRPGARWAVEAGPFTVQVIGTVFDVRWSAEDDRLEVRLLRGRVDVRGPVPGGSVTLHEGQRLQARAGQADVRVDAVRVEMLAAVDDAPTNAGASSIAAAPSPIASPAPLTALDPTVTPFPPATAAAPVAIRGLRRAPTPARAVALARAGPGGPAGLGASWQQRVASGDFRGVLDEAEEHGLDDCLRIVAVDRLALLADAARYVGRGDVARRALLAQRQRFPGAPTARGAAFLLGRLAETDTDGGGLSAAIAWYDRYLDEAADGPFAAEALGRKMLVLQRQGDGAAASAAARLYLDRFPAGPHAAPARAIRQGAP